MMALEIQDLWKAYDGHWAVQGLSLEVKPGEIVGLVGPNGAGKTTTLKAVVGLVEKDRGRIAVHGTDVDRAPEAYKGHLGYLPEAPSLPEYLNAREFLGYVARLRGVGAGEVPQRVEDSLAAFGLAARGREALSGYSKGMKQRLAIASSVIHNPDLLVWDEPFLGIDPAGQHQVKELLRDYVARGPSALISTHVLDTAERLCHRVVVVNHGRALAQGDLAALRTAAALGQGSTLEEVFLKLTEEGAEPMEEAKPRRGLLRWWRRA